jgi:hypothetical protein
LSNENLKKHWYLLENNNMRIFNTGQISPSEKQDILDKHRTLYNGFRTMEPKVSNEQPLYIQDFAGDKLGMTINNKGEVKKYTNFGINESIEEGETCEQCGGQMNEGICEQCGSGEMEEGKGHLDDIYDEEDLNPSDDFDYVEGGGNNYGTFEKMHHMKEEDAEIDELGTHELKKGKKYKYKTPSFDDEVEFDFEVDDEEGGDRMYKFKGKDAMNHLMAGKGVEKFVDYLDEQSKKRHQTKEGTATSNAPVSLGKHYDEIKDPYSFQSDGPVGNGKTLRMSNVDEQGRTGGGNAPDFDFDLNADPAFDFKSRGPKEGDGPFSVDAPDMDLDMDDEKKPYDFRSGGPDNGGEVYPVFEDSFDSLIDMDNELENEREELEEDDFEEFTSAFDDEIDEVDVSGSQGIYGDMDPAYDFDSEGPGKAGPYQRRNEAETSEQIPRKHDYKKMMRKKDAISRGEDFDDSELDISDYEDDYNPETSSWEEITKMTGDDEFGNVDEDIRESLIKQKNKINEMFLRMKVVK